MIGAVLRAYSYQLGIVAGVVIIIMGLHFLGVFRIGALLQGKVCRDDEAGRALGRLCDGACLRVRMDAVHRTDPGRHPRSRGRREHRCQGCRPARRLFGGTRHSVSACCLVVGPFAKFLARFRRHLAHVERAMGALLVLTGIAFLTGFVSTASFWLLDTFPALGTIG